MEKYSNLGDAIAFVTSDRKVEKEDWSVKLALDAFNVLKSRFPETSNYRIQVLNNSEPTAFTVDGKYIFLTRSLLEVCNTIEMVAFIIAHEIAHHELGHVPTSSKRLKGKLKVVAFLSRCIRSPVARAHMENDADMLALDMCVEAGLSGRKCSRTFQVLEKITIDSGGIDVAFGSDAFYCPEMSSFERRWKIFLYLLSYGVNAGVKLHQPPEQMCTALHDLAGVKVHHLA